MKYNLSNGNLEINMDDIINNLTYEEKRAIAEVLVWDKEIFDDLVQRLMGDQIVTDSMSRGIYEARIKFMELLPVMDQNIIRSLMHLLEAERAEQGRYHCWAWEMYHAWPKEFVRHMPKMPEFQNTRWAKDVEVQEVMAAERAKLS